MVRVERRGRAREAPGGREGGYKEGEGERERRKRRRRGKGKEREKRERLARRDKSRWRGGNPQRRDTSRGILYLPLCFPSLSLISSLHSFLSVSVLWYSLSRLSSQPLSLLPRSGQESFIIKKSVTCLSGYTAPHSCAACTGNSNTTSFPVNRR